MQARSREQSRSKHQWQASAFAALARNLMEPPLTAGVPHRFLVAFVPFFVGDWQYSRPYRT